MSTPTSQRWQGWSAVQDLFDGPADAAWEHDRDLLVCTPARPEPFTEVQPDTPPRSEL